MIVFSTIGLLEIVQQDPDRLLVVTQADETMQALVDGVALLAGGETIEPQGLSVVVPRDVFADWLAFEVQQFVDYSDFPRAVIKSLGVYLGKVANNLHQEFRTPPNEQD